MTEQGKQAPDADSAGDTSPGPDWWKASDGEWYPPSATPSRGLGESHGWWRASDGAWYPPQMPPGWVSTQARRTGWHSVPRGLKQATGVWLAVLIVTGCIAGYLPTAGSPYDERGCPTTQTVPPSAVILWLVVVVASLMGAAVFWRRDRRLTPPIVFGVVGAFVGPVGVWILSYNPCWT